MDPIWEMGLDFFEAPVNRPGGEPPAPFSLPADRSEVTHEPRQAGSHPVPEHEDQDWIDFSNQGGGSVPADYAWLSNPKERQDEISAG